MYQHNEQIFGQLMATLYEIYDQPGSPLKTEIYYKALEEYSIDQVKKAIAQLIKTRQYQSFPKPGEIITIIEGSTNELEDIALEQFLKAKNTIISHGAYRNIKFDDPIIHKVIESMGGWVNFCMTELDKWAFKEKEFIRYYVLYKKQEKQGVLEELPYYLAGISPTANIIDVKTLHPSKIRPQLEQDKSKSVMKELSQRLKNVRKKGDDNK